VGQPPSVIGVAALGRLCTALLAAGAFLAACGSGSGTPAATGAVPRLPGATVSVQAEFAGNETFCAGSPLTGTIRYVVSHHEARLEIGVGGLPASTTVVVDWLNNSVRGYVVGTCSTDPTGSPLASTVRFYRPGETRGQEIQLTSSDAAATVLGVLRPCG
jgi:hypothetical protein